MERKRQRLLILILLALILLGVGASVVYFIVESREKVVTMQSALDAYEKKDYVKAIRLFREVLSKDSDNEMAVSKLAEIYCSLEDWHMSSYYWQQACHLNNLNSEYEQNFVNMSLRGRFFSRIVILYTDSRHTKLNLDEKLVLAYCQLMARDPRNGIELWKKIVSENPNVVEKPYGKLIKTTHFAADQTFEQIFKSLDELIASKDANISQEALIALSNLHRRLRQYEDEEKNLKKVTELNFFIGAPMLGEFYSNHFKYKEAIDIFEKYLDKYSNNRIAMVLGELLLFTNQHEKLENLAGIWKKKTGKNNISVAYYLSSVNALAKHDFNAMTTAYQPVHGRVNTVLSAFIAILVDTHTNDMYRLEEDLRWFQRFPPFFDFRKRVHTLVLLYLEDRIRAGTSAKDLLRLAEFLLSAKFTDDPNAIPMLVSLIGKLQSNSLTESNLKSTIQKLPNDPTCMEVAIVFHYSRGDYAEAKKYLEQLEKMKNVKLSQGIQKLAINILIIQGNIDEAAKRLFALLEEDKSADSFITCLLFCIENGRKEELRLLAEKIGDDKNLEPVKLFCNAAIQLLDGSKDEALDVIERIDTEDDRLLFFAGRELASNGRQSQAIGKLTKINHDFSGYLNVLETLATIYVDMGDAAKAKAAVEKALALAPGSAELKRILAMCFHLEGNWQKALENSAPLLWEKNGDEELRKIWIWAMEKNIVSEFNARRYLVAKHFCVELIKYDKDNKIGTEYLSKADDMIERQKKSEAE